MIEEAHPDTVLAHAMRALGHPVRLSILRILAEKCDPQCCCTEVAQCLPLAQSTVSQHIKVLLEAGLVKRDARGTRNCYSIDFARLDALQVAYDSYLSGLRPKRGAPIPASVPESV